MTGLQRSAVSFRRQGSSGMIWDDRIIHDPLHRLSLEEKNNGQSKPRLLEETCPGSKPSTPSTAISKVRQQQKPQKCGFSVIFGRCGGIV